MTTLLLSEIFPPKIGGSGRWFWEVYRRLPRDAYVIAAGEDAQQSVFDGRHDRPLVRCPLSFPNWGISNASGLRAYLRALRCVNRVSRRYRVEYLHCGRVLPEGWIGWLRRRLYGTPYLCYVHGEELSYANLGRELNWMIRRVVAGSSLFIANSRNTAGILEKSWRVAPARIRVLHPGADTDYFVPAAADSAEKQRLGWSGRTVVLTVGRLEKRKGQDQLIRALATIRRAVPDVLYAIAGEGDMRQQLEQLVEQRQLREHVQFRGAVADDELLRCYQQCDLFVLPNREIAGDIEGFGMVLVEAQACGKPVVAGTSGGTAETMRSPDTGRLVCCENTEPLAEVIVELLQDAPRRVRMGAAGRRWAEENFGWNRLAQAAAELFDQMPARSSRLRA